MQPLESSHPLLYPVMLAIGDGARGAIVQTMPAAFVVPARAHRRQGRRGQQAQQQGQGQQDRQDFSAFLVNSSLCGDLSS